MSTLFGATFQALSFRVASTFSLASDFAFVFLLLVLLLPLLLLLLLVLLLSLRLLLLLLLVLLLLPLLLLCHYDCYLCARRQARVAVGRYSHSRRMGSPAPVFVRAEK